MYKSLSFLDISLLIDTERLDRLATSLGIIIFTKFKYFDRFQIWDQKNPLSNSPLKISPELFANIQCQVKSELLY
jgi:hypothetical protein